MVDLLVFKDFLVAIAIGALIGMEREIAQQKNKTRDFAGLRTFIFITLLGAIVGYISEDVFKSHTFTIVAFFGFTLLIIASYTVTAILHKKIGATTEITGLLAFLLGLMCTIGLTTLALVFTVLIATILVMRPILHNFAKKIEKEEIYATLEFAIISIVVLPFLPNYNFSPMEIPGVADVIRNIPFFSVEVASKLDVFNPYKIWLMVVFISGISFVGYISIKAFGANRGLGLTGFLGGLVSSTAVTTSLANESKRIKKAVNPFILGTLVACSTMFLRVLFEVMVVNNSMVKYLFIPMSMMAVTGFISAVYFWKKQQKEHKQSFDFKSPFRLSPALKFGLFFGFVLFIAKFAQIMWGSKGVYLASLLSGLADVDAITLSMANLSHAGDISAKVAVTAITIATATNTAVKGGIAYLFGAKEFGLAIMKIFGLILLLGLASTLLL